MTILDEIDVRIAKVELKLEQLEKQINAFFTLFAECRKEMLECGCRRPAPVPKYYKTIQDWYEDQQDNK